MTHPLAPREEGPAGSGAPMGRSAGSVPRLDELAAKLIDSVADYAIFLLAPDGTVVTWNAGGVALKGYAANEIIGHHFSKLYSLEDIAAGKPRFELELASRDGRFEDEGWRIRKDGSHFWASVIVTALRDATGELLGYGKITRDLTDRVLANEQFRLALEGAPTGMLLVDEQGSIGLANAHVEKLFGYTRAELIGERIERLVPGRIRGTHASLRKEFHGSPRARPMGAGRDLSGLCKDGREVPVEIGLNPIETPDGRHVLVSILDISERREALEERERLLAELRQLNAELEARVEARTADLLATLREREILLQEVHHRVKNNLTVISSLIDMQVRMIEKGRSRDALEECQARVHAIALIHEKLYQSADYANVPFSDYVQSLAENVFHTLGVSRSDVSLELSIERVLLAVDRAIPCGMILNELITNAIRHAFPGGRRGTIRVELSSGANGTLLLSVADDGVGLPPGFDPRETQSLGLQLVDTLVRQLEAELRIERSAGARFEIIIPLAVDPLGRQNVRASTAAGGAWPDSTDPRS